MKARMLGAAALTFGIAVSASAQAADLVPGDRDASAQLAKIVETTRAAGLPSDPILGTVNHGVQVHASPTLIVEAARKLASRLRSARDYLGPAVSDNDLLAAADAILEGANRESLRAIRDANRSRPLATPFGVLTQLLAEPLNTPLKKATQIVKDFIERDATSAQLVAFTNDLNDDVISRGMQGHSAVDARVRMLTAVLAPAGTAAAALSQDHAAAAAPGRSGPPKRP